MSKSRKTDISSLFDYSIEVSDKLEKKLSHANKQNKRKKKNRKNKGKLTNKKYNKSDEFEELKKYIFDLYYVNTLRQDMLVWAMASMLGSNNKDHEEDNIIKISGGENDDTKSC